MLSLKYFLYLSILSVKYKKFATSRTNTYIFTCGTYTKSISFIWINIVLIFEGFNYLEHTSIYDP